MGVCLCLGLCLCLCLSVFVSGSLSVFVFISVCVHAPNGKLHAAAVGNGVRWWGVVQHAAAPPPFFPFHFAIFHPFFTIVFAMRVFCFRRIDRIGAFEVFLVVLRFFLRFVMSHSL